MESPATPSHFTLGSRDVLLPWYGSPGGSPANATIVGGTRDRSSPISSGRQQSSPLETTLLPSPGSTTDPGRLAAFGGKGGGPERRELQTGYALQGDTTLGRDLLSTQLRDLDTWCNNQRRADVSLEERAASPGKGVRFREQETLQSPQQSAAESLLQAQLKELGAWQVETRIRSQEAQQKLRLLDEFPDAHNRKDDTWMWLDLGCERRVATKRLDQIGATAEAPWEIERRMNLVSSAFLKLRDSENSKMKALDKAQGIQQQSVGDFRRIHAQLAELEDEPWHTPELSAYSTTDVALAFVGAIEQRLALKRTLIDALRMRDDAKSALDLHEQLISCTAVEQNLRNGSLPVPPEPTDLMTAPAARLALEGSSLAEIIQKGAHEGGYDSGNSNQVQRLLKIAEQNFKHWADLSKLQQQVQHLLALQRQGHQDARAATKSKAGVSSPTHKLQSELQTLRSAEGKLDALLQQESGSGAAGAQIAVDGSSKKEPKSLEKNMQDVMTMMYMATSVSDIFNAWRFVAEDLRDWRKQRRFSDRRRYLGTRGPRSWPHWFFVNSMSVVVEKPLPQNLRRVTKPRVRDSEGYEGIVLSSTSEGMCKVQYGIPPKHEVLVLPSKKLIWLQDTPHPALAWVAFSFWALHSWDARALATQQTRKKLKDRGNTTVGLLTSSSDPHSAQMFFFGLWRRAVKKASDDIRNTLLEFWKCWRQTVHQSRHERSVHELQKTKLELHTARISILQQRGSHDRIKRRLIKINEAELVLLLTTTWSAWHHSTQVSIEMAQLIKDTERQMKQAYDDGVIAAYRVTGFLNMKSARTYKRDAFRLWRKNAHKQKNQSLVRKNVNNSFYKRGVDWAFHAWRHISVQRYIDIQKQLREDLSEANEEVATMQDMSKELWGFANDANARVHELEDLLRSADIVMQSGAKQQGNLEEKVEFLKSRIKVLEDQVTDLASGPLQPSEDDVLRIKQDARDTLPQKYISELEDLLVQVDRDHINLYNLENQVEDDERYNDELQEQINEIKAEQQAYDNETDRIHSEIRQSILREEREAAAVAGGGGGGHGDVAGGDATGGAGDVEPEPAVHTHVDRSSPSVVAELAAEEEAATVIQLNYRRWSALWKLQAKKDGILATSEGVVSFLGPPGGRVFTKPKPLDLNEIGDLPKYKKACAICEGKGGISSMELWVPSFRKTEKTEYMFKVARWNWDEYLFNVHGVDIFTLEDLHTANWIWNGTKKAAITKLTQNGKGRYELHKIEPKFFKALLKVTMEAQYRRDQGFTPDDGISADDPDAATAADADPGSESEESDLGGAPKAKAKPKAAKKTKAKAKSVSFA